MNYITVKDVMLKYKVARQTVNNWIKQGMPSHKFGTLRRFIEEEVDEWVKNREVK